MSKDNGRIIMDLGKSIVIKGYWIASEGSDAVRANGRERDAAGGHTLTIGRHADIHAAIDAKAVVIQGAVTGNVTAGEKVEIQTTLCLRRRLRAAPRHRRRRLPPRKG